MEPENWEYPSDWWDSQTDRDLVSAAEEIKEEPNYLQDLESFESTLAEIRETRARSPDLTCQ